MTPENLTMVRNLREFATRADEIARAIEGHRVRVEHGGRVSAASIEQPHRTNTYRGVGDISVTAIAHLGQCVRDLASTYDSALAALPASVVRVRP
jgi:hypothetical protein